MLWEKTIDEVERGWLAGPFALFEFDISDSLPARRIGVVQKDKVRGVDNLKRSGCNDGAAVVAPIQQPRVDDLCEVGERVFKNHGAVWLFKAGHKDAYRQLPLRPADATAAATSLKKNPLWPGRRLCAKNPGFRQRVRRARLQPRCAPSAIFVCEIFQDSHDLLLR